MDLPCKIVRKLSAPLVAAAIHDGHALRPELKEHIALGDAERRREEDPFTAQWTAVAPTRIAGTVSRFEVDLNRPRDGAVYLAPDDAWGLDVWNVPLSSSMIEASLARYDAFYGAVAEMFDELHRRFGRFVVFDIHSYNHRRAGPHAPVADPAENPEVNIGTRSMDRARWAPVVERLMRDLASFPFRGRNLDVRENVKFGGGHFPRWVHCSYPDSACAIAIEFKKFFMDECTGEPYSEKIDAIGGALASTVPGVLEELERLPLER